MLNVSDDFTQAISRNKRNMVIEVKIKDKIYTKNDIKSVVFDFGSAGGSTFGIGGIFSNTVKIELCSIVEGLKETDPIEIKIGILTKDASIVQALDTPFRMGSAKIGKARLIEYHPDTYEYVKMGKFYINGRVDPDRNENKTTVEAADGFIFLEGNYESKLSYPARICDVALEIANLSGTEINKTSFNKISISKIQKPTGYTYRQAIGLISQFEGGFARFDRDGLLDIRQLEDSKYRVNTQMYFSKGLVKNEVLYRVDGISCKVSTKGNDGAEATTTLQSGSSKGNQITFENNVMTQTLLDSIYQKIRNLNFYPYTLKWRGHPAVETGDWIEVEDKKGNRFKVPNLNCKLTFSGGLSAESSADTEVVSNVTYAYRGPIQQTLDNMNERIDAAGKNSIYEGIDEPPHPKEGDLWFKPNGPDTEIWVYSKTDDGYEWKMTASTKMDEDIREKIENATPSDEIVKTINLSSEMDGKEWLKIVGAKLWLTNQTKIDNAIITSAMIASVDAGTVNTGTLNAGKIAVINLDASKISSGYLNADRIASRSITANHLAANAIQVGFNNLGSTLQLSSTSLSFYNGSDLAGRLSSAGMEYWLGTVSVGRTGSTTKTGNPSVRGIGHHLETSGDFITWGYRQTASATSFTAMLTLDPKGKFTGTTGVHCALDLLINSDKAVKSRYFRSRGYTNEAGFSLMPVTTNGVTRSFFGSDNGHNGIVATSSGLWFNSGNYLYAFGNIIAVTEKLRGLGKICIPSAINSSGVVTSWYNLTL